MRRIGKLSAMFATAVATLTLSAAAASAATTTAAAPAAMTTSASAASAAAPDATCTVVGSGSPGYITFTLHVSEDTCGQTVKAAVECVLSIYQGPYTDPYVYEAWAYGPHVTKAGTTSEADCGPANVYFLTYGYQVLNSNGTWTYHQLGTE